MAKRLTLKEQLARLKEIAGSDSRRRRRRSCVPRWRVEAIFSWRARRR